MVSPDLLSIPPWAQNKANGPIFLAHPAEGGDDATSEAREPRGSGIWVCFARYSVPRASNRTRQDVSTRQIFVDLREKTLPVPAWSLCARCRVKSLRSVLSLNPTTFPEAGRDSRDGLGYGCRGNSPPDLRSFRQPRFILCSFYTSQLGAVSWGSPHPGTHADGSVRISDAARRRGRGKRSSEGCQSSS